MRQEVSAEAQTSAPVESTWPTLSESMAMEVSAFFRAKVPPNPQHSSPVRQVDQVDAVHRAEQPPRAVAHAECAQRVAGGVVRHAVRERRADILGAEVVHDQFGQLAQARSQRGQLRPEGLVAGVGGQARGQLAQPAGARGRRAYDQLLAGEDPGGAAREVESLVTVTGVAVHLAAAGLLLGKRHLAPEALQEFHDRPPHTGEERVVEAGDEQGDPDGSRDRPHP